MSRLILIKPIEKYAEQVMDYKNEMLKLLLPICKDMGEHKLLLTCDKGNIFSSKTILNNGGILENEVVDSVGLSKTGVIQRYWITL